MTSPIDAAFNRTADVIVIGGGMAGATAAFHLAQHGEVILLEQENELAFHTTSRSAALYTETDSGPVAQKLAKASKAFFENPPGETDAPLVGVQGMMIVGPECMADQMAQQVEADQKIAQEVHFLTGSEVTDICPILRPERAAVASYEPNAGPLDVMAIHQVFIRQARAQGLRIARGARVESLTRADGVWTARTPEGDFHAPVVVNAAGAWGDHVAGLAGAAPVGLTPMRRTAFTTDVGIDSSAWPFVYTGVADGHCYFKPEAGNQIMGSLADETPSAAVDARPEEIDVAQAIDHLNQLTTLGIRSVKTTWAGLRTFAPDRNQVLGWDDEVEGFCWMVGQGGSGIITAPAVGEIVSSIVRNQPWPERLAALGLRADALTIARLR